MNEFATLAIVLIPLISGLVTDNSVCSLVSVSYVLIPLISGLVTDLADLSAGHAQRGLNPFDFRAGY